jgi:hypothetical protein
MRARLARFAFDQGGLLALVAAVAYAVLAPAHVVDADNAELSALAESGGVPHPSGYPLYLLYLRALAWLPVGTPAHAAAIATALLAGGAILALHAAARGWGARPAAAAIACGIYAGAPVVMRLSTEAEVFALESLLVGLVLWLAAPSGPVRGARRAILLGLVAGLALSDHLSCVLVAPVGLYGVVVGFREADRRRRVAIAGATAGALVAGLLPYLYLLVAPDDGMSWGRIDSLGALARHFLRADYGTGQLAATGVDVPLADGLGALATTVGRSWLWLPAGLGLAVLVGSPVRAAAKVAWGCLLLSVVLAGPILISRFNIPPTPGVPLHVCQRLHLLTVTLLVVPVAVGLDLVVRWIGVRRALPEVRPALLAAGGVIAFVAAGAASLPELRRVHSPALERAIRVTLETAPKDAVLLVQGDHYHFVGAYLQYARGVRPDVVMITGSMTPMKWYRDDVDARLGFPALPPAEGDADLRLAGEVLARGRPLLVDRNYGPIARAYATYPYGMLARVVPPGETPPSVDAVFAQNKELFERIDFGYPPPRPGDNWPAFIHAEYARTWRLLADGLAASGRADDAQWARDLATGLAPK